MIRMSRTAQRVSGEKPVEHLRAEACAYIPCDARLTVCGHDAAARLEHGGRQARQSHEERLFGSGRRWIRCGHRAIRRPSTHKKAGATPGSQRKSGMAERVHARRKEKENEPPATLPQNCTEGAAVEAKEPSPSHRAVTTPTLTCEDLGFSWEGRNDSTACTDLIEDRP
jgi:hypothetical protein